MATELKLRRGNTTQHSSFTGAEAEVTVDTDKNTVVVHDGSQSGGFPLAKDDGSNVSNFAITGKLTAVDAKFTGTTAITLPDGTQAQRPSSPQTGMLRFNTDLDSFEGYDGSAWGEIGGGGGATGGGEDQIFYENDQAVTTDYTVTSNRNAMTAGPIDVQSGVTVTVESGARWVVV